MTKFRLSNHKLMIETGRHRNMDKTIRICPFCTSVEETCPKGVNPIPDAFVIETGVDAVTATVVTSSSIVISVSAIRMILLQSLSYY